MIIRENKIIDQFPTPKQSTIKFCEQNTAMLIAVREN